MIPIILYISPCTVHLKTVLNHSCPCLCPLPPAQAGGSVPGAAAAAAAAAAPGTAGGTASTAGGQPDYSAAWAEYYRQQAAYYGQSGQAPGQPANPQQGQVCTEPSNKPDVTYLIVLHPPLTSSVLLVFQTQ